MINTTKVTIIIATYNSGKTLERTINSIINQTYQFKELIIIDGGSKDSTVELLKIYKSSIDYYISELDDGIYDAWNKGVQVAKGEWICFIGSDDYFLDKDCLGKLVEYTNLVNNENTKLIYCDLHLFKNNIFSEKIGKPWNITKKNLKITMTMPHVGLLHHCTLFQEFGLFNIKYKIAGDYDFMLRVTKKYNAYYIENFAVIGMSIGGVSTQKDMYFNLIKEEFLARRDNHIFPYNSLFFKRVAYWYLRKFLLIFGKSFFFKIKSVFNAS